MSDISVGSVGATLLIALGTGLSLVLAARSFQHRLVQFAGQPALPRYLTRPKLYVVGLVSYSVLVLAFYVALILYWGPLADTFGPIVDKNTFVGKLVDRGTTGEPNKSLIPWLAAAVVLYLISWESKYNPLLIVREVIFDAVSIPRMAVNVYQSLRNAEFRNLNEVEIAAVLRAPTVTAVCAGDFKVNRNTVEYKWSHICYLLYSALKFADQPSYESVFGDEMMRWDSIRTDYLAVGSQVTAWKTDHPDYTETLGLIATLDDLTLRLYRLLACAAVFGNGNEKQVWDFVQEVTKSSAIPAPKDITPFVLLFTASILLTILIGRELSVAAYHQFIGPANDIPPWDANKMAWWASISILLYIVPITLMFWIRNYFRQRFPFEGRRYWNLYLGFGAMAFGIAILSLPTTAGVGFDLSSPVYWAKVTAGIQWGFLPALMCGYVAFRMDSIVPPAEPARRMIMTALARFTLCGATGLVVLTWASLVTVLPNSDHLSPSQTFVIVASGTLLVGVLGALSRFRAN